MPNKDMVKRLFRPDRFLTSGQNNIVCIVCPTFPEDMTVMFFVFPLLYKDCGMMVFRLRKHYSGLVSSLALYSHTAFFLSAVCGQVVVKTRHGGRRYTCTPYPIQRI